MPFAISLFSAISITCIVYAFVLWVSKREVTMLDIEHLSQNAEAVDKLEPSRACGICDGKGVDIETKDGKKLKYKAPVECGTCHAVGYDF